MMIDWKLQAKCNNCGASLAREIERSQLAKDRPGGITEMDGQSATIRRMDRQLCWLCNHLHLSAQDAATVDAWA
jgi:hypothetical protein